MANCPRSLPTDPTLPGLPRALRLDPAGCLRPVPWTQGEKDWGDISSDALERAHAESLCLVCGHEVRVGVVFWDCVAFMAPSRPSQGYVLRSALGNYLYPIPDGGCLHRRCAKITRAHCRTIRDRFKNGGMIEVPYYIDVLTALECHLADTDA